MRPYLNRLRAVQSHAPLVQHLRFLCSWPASNSKLFIAGIVYLLHGSIFLKYHITQLNFDYFVYV
jgi:hypothetical protein